MTKYHTFNVFSALTNESIFVLSSISTFPSDFHTELEGLGRIHSVCKNIAIWLNGFSSSLYYLAVNNPRLQVITLKVINIFIFILHAEASSLIELKMRGGYTWRYLQG